MFKTESHWNEQWHAFSELNLPLKFWRASFWSVTAVNKYFHSVRFSKDQLSIFMLWLGLALWWKYINIQSITERWRQTLGMSSTYQNKKKLSISMCLGTVNLWVIAETMYDGALADSSSAVWDVLNNTCHDRWKGIGGHIAWPPRLPDLNLMDFYLWGHLNTLVCAAPVDNEEALHRHIVDVCQTIHTYPSISEQTWRSMMRRDEACIEIS
jgi:hypothetical protein